jgi:hypothetical protein
VTLFCGQLSSGQAKVYGVRQCYVGDNGMVARPFIGSARRGGSPSRESNGGRWISFKASVT